MSFLHDATTDVMCQALEPEQRLDGLVLGRVVLGRDEEESLLQRDEVAADEAVARPPAVSRGLTLSDAGPCTIGERQCGNSIA